MAQGIELPKLTDGYLGPQTKFGPYGLTAVSHPEPIIQMDSGIVEIVIGMSSKTRMTTKFLSVDRKKEMNEYTLVQWEPSSFRFLISPPEKGWYKFQIYALPSGEAGPQMVGVYNYVIYCPGYMADVIPFPKQYPQWKEGGYLFEPLQLKKGIKDDGVKFKVHIPGAKDVMLKIHNEWVKLEPSGEPNIYEGYANFSQINYPRDAKVKLNVKFSGNNYNTLIEYTI